MRIKPSKARSLAIISLFFFLIWLSSCNQNDDVTVDDNTGQSLLFQPTAGKSMLTVNYQTASTQDIPSQEVSLPVLIHVPNDYETLVQNGPIPTVVVVHGSGGLWEEDNTTVGEMSSQFDAWRDILNDEGMMAVFIESFQPRGIQKNNNLSVADKLKISEQFIRPRDIEATTQMLRTLVTDDNQKVIGNIALLGFSHGGSTVRNAVHDCSTTNDINNWSVSFDGVSYDVPAPVCDLDSEGVVAVVSYYPGGFDRGYWGNPREGNSVYRNGVPMMVHMAENDDLTSDTKDLVENNLVGHTEVQHFIYSQAEHSFDHPSATGADLEARNLAQQRTLEFLELHLNQ